jgi:hypothetical protein
MVQSVCSSKNWITGTLNETELAELENRVLLSRRRILREDGCWAGTFFCKVVRVSLAQESRNNFTGFVEVETTKDVVTEQLVERVTFKGIYPIDIITKKGGFIWKVTGRIAWERKYRRK